MAKGHSAGLRSRIAQRIDTWEVLPIGPVRARLRRLVNRQQQRMIAGLIDLHPSPDIPRGTRVNVGSGDKTREGFINLDLRTTGDIIADARRLPFASSSVAHILAEDVLEHFPRHEIDVVLQEWRRVLMVGAQLELRVPNLAYLGKLLTTGRSLDDAIENIYGGHRWGPAGAWDAHHWGWTPAGLHSHLRDHRFATVSNDREPNMRVYAKKLE